MEPVRNGNDDGERDPWMLPSAVTGPGPYRPRNAARHPTIRPAR